MQETKVILFSMRLFFNNPGGIRASSIIWIIIIIYNFQIIRHLIKKKKFAALKLRVGSPETTREAPYNKGEDIVRPGRKLLLSPRKLAGR